METIKGNQYSVLAYFLFRTFIFGMIVDGAIALSRQDAWLSVIVSTVIGIIPLILYYFLLNHDENLNINGLIDKYFNKYIAFIIKFLLVAFFIFHASMLLWNIGNFISSQFLYKTPITAIMIILLIPIFYLNCKKITTIGRSSIIFLLMATALIIFTIITLASHIKLDNLLPIYEYGFKPILHGGITNLSYSSLSVFALLIIPKNNIQNNKGVCKKVFFAYLISSFILLLILIYVISIFGINLSLLYEYPEFNILKMVNIGDFIQRIESILSRQWFFDIIIGMTIYVYYIKSTIIDKIKINNKILLLIISVILIVLARNIFANNTIAYEFLIYKYPYIILFFLFLIPLIILIKVKK